MPYIDKIARESLTLCGDWPPVPANAGQLNFCITKLIWDYYDVNKKYQTINDVLGALEGAKLEFYRRVAAPYEDKKIQENGDVFV